MVWTRLAVKEMVKRKLDSGYILKVESMSFTDRLIVRMKHKEESRMT